MTELDEVWSALKLLVEAVDHEVRVKGEPPTETLATEVKWARLVVARYAQRPLR